MKQPRNDACGLYFKYQERVQSGGKNELNIIYYRLV